MTEEKEMWINLKRSDVIEVLAHLNCLVLSLDRIGSCVDMKDVDQLTIDFIDDWKVFLRLATCRSVLSGYFSRELGEDGMEELERELQDVAYWQSSARNPPDPAESAFRNDKT